MMYAGSQNSGIYKIPVANPGSAVDQQVNNFRFGILRFGQGRSFAGQRNGTTAGNLDKTGLYLSDIDKANLSLYTQTTAEAVGGGGRTHYTGTLSVVSGKKTCMYVAIKEAGDDAEIKLALDTKEHNNKEEAAYAHEAIQEIQAGKRRRRSVADHRRPTVVCEAGGERLRERIGAVRPRIGGGAEPLAASGLATLPVESYLGGILFREGDMAQRKKLSDVQKKALDESDSILKRAFKEAGSKRTSVREGDGSFGHCLRCDCGGYVSPTGTAAHSQKCQRVGCGHLFSSHDVF